MNKKELFLYSEFPKTRDQLQMVFETVGLEDINVIYTNNPKDLEDPHKLKLVFPCNDKICSLCRINMDNLFIINSDHQNKICPLRKNIFNGPMGLREFIKKLKIII